MTWKDRGACVDQDTDLFFAEKGDHAAVRKARSICATCPVRQQCLDYAVDECIDHGVWGGTTYTERRALRAGGGQPTWICSVPGCDRLPYGQVGVCTAHYKRLQDHGDVRAHIPIEPRRRRRIA